MQIMITRIDFCGRESNSLSEFRSYLIVLRALFCAADKPICGPQGELYIIDVSQAVDLDHPRALDFLREDALHVNTFFRRAGIATLTTRELFDFTVDPGINASNVDAALDRLAAAAASRPIGYEDAEAQTADSVRFAA